MVTQKELDHVLLVTLKDLGFANRYYAHYEARRGSSQIQGFSQNFLATLLEGTGLRFKWDRRERIYLAEEEIEGTHARIAIWERGSVLESSVCFQLPNGALIGGPFHGLALDAAQLVNKYTLYNPAYPRLPFSTLAELQETVTLLVALYREMTHILLATKGFSKLAAAKFKKGPDGGGTDDDPHMVDENKIEEDFCAILREMLFGQRYFEQCNKFPIAGLQVQEADILPHLAKQSATFTRNQRPRFLCFDLKDKVQHLSITYSVLLEDGGIDFAMGISPRAASYGGRYSYLAQKTSDIVASPYANDHGNCHLWANTGKDIATILQVGAAIHKELKSKLRKSRLTPLANLG